MSSAYLRWSNRSSCALPANFLLPARCRDCTKLLAQTARDHLLPCSTQEFDLSKLSAEEKAAIEHRKALEKVCRYPVDELHSRALRAEGEIGALVVYLMHKHGAHGVCEQKDRRSAVRGQLSILRQLVDTFIQEEAMHEQQLHEQMLTYLRGVSAFENVNETTLNAIAASLDVKAFKQGETILKKGDPGSTFFLIKEGTVGFSLNVGHPMPGSAGIRERSVLRVAL